MNKNTLLNPLLALSLVGGLNAAIVTNVELITDGSFETGGLGDGGGFLRNFDNWFEANEDGGAQSDGDTAEAGEPDGGNAPAPTDGTYWGNVKSLNSIDGAVYQSLGTWASGNVTTLDLESAIGSRNADNSARQYGGFAIEIYTGTGFTGADNTDIAASSLTLRDTTGYQTLQTLGRSAADRTTEWTGTYTTSFDLTGINDGDEIWLNISVRANDNDYTLDATGYTNVAGQSMFDELSVVAVVPEPSAYALIGGFLALGWVMVRRRS